jgi:hypothetical protein
MDREKGKIKILYKKTKSNLNQTITWTEPSPRTSLRT